MKAKRIASGVKWNAKMCENGYRRAQSMSELISAPPRSILPWDVETITETRSVNHTDHLFIVCETGMMVSVGGSQCRSEAIRKT